MDDYEDAVNLSARRRDGIVAAHDLQRGDRILHSSRKITQSYASISDKEPIRSWQTFSDQTTTFDDDIARGQTHRINREQHDFERRREFEQSQPRGGPKASKRMTAHMPPRGPNKQPSRHRTGPAPSHDVMLPTYQATSHVFQNPNLIHGSQNNQAVPDLPKTHKKLRSHSEQDKRKAILPESNITYYEQKPILRRRRSRDGRNPTLTIQNNQKLTPSDQWLEAADAIFLSQSSSNQDSPYRKSNKPPPRVMYYESRLPEGTDKLPDNCPIGLDGLRRLTVGGEEVVLRPIFTKSKPKKLGDINTPEKPEMSKISEKSEQTKVSNNLQISKVPKKLKKVEKVLAPKEIQKAKGQGFGLHTSKYAIPKADTNQLDPNLGN